MGNSELFIKVINISSVLFHYCVNAIVNSVWDIIMNNQMYLMDDINEAGKS